MWGLSDSDKKHIDAQIRRDKKRENALKIARARGNAAQEWLKNNELTPDTKPEFNALMKKVTNLNGETNRLRGTSSRIKP